MSKYSENQPPDLKTAIGWMYDHIKSNSVFLDFGCSTGYFGSLVKKGKGCKVYGVEISDDAKQARRVLDGVYSFDLDGEWPKEIYERKYDHLFFGDVLEHLKDPAVVLQKAKKLLQKDGTVFISIPNIAHISTRLELLQGNFEYESMGILDSTHLKYFTLNSFSRIAQDSGYRVAEVDYTVNDYPREVIEKIIKQVGLKVENKKFWDLMDTVEARSYQYKFILKPIDKPEHQKKLPLSKLPDKPERQRDEYIADLRTQAEVLHRHADEQAKIIKHYVNLYESIKKENEILKQKPLHTAIKNVVKTRISKKRKTTEDR